MFPDKPKMKLSRQFVTPAIVLLGNGHDRVQGLGSRIKPSMFTDRNKSPEVNEEEGEDSDVKKDPEVNEEEVEEETSTEFGTISMQENH